ncbi:MAG: PhoH family protein, partial [Pseudonocardiaceae bacterium]
MEGAARSGSELTQPGPIQSKVVIPDSAVLALLGSRDENLKVTEALLAADVHVRGN